MKVTIVYESMFGNTHQVAQAIRDGIRETDPNADVQCVPVADASAEVGSTDLLIVGGPTHIRGMTSGFSRKMGISGEEKAEAKGEPRHELEPDAEGPGLREWFDGLRKIGDGKKAAAFDTRLESPMAGGAAHGIARRLRRHGYNLVTDPVGFVVDDSYGPLRAGEIERAKQWGTQLVQ
jgi:Flavodoxin